MIYTSHKFLLLPALRETTSFCIIVTRPEKILFGMLHKNREFAGTVQVQMDSTTSVWLEPQITCQDDLFPPPTLHHILHGKKRRKTSPGTWNLELKSNLEWAWMGPLRVVVLWPVSCERKVKHSLYILSFHSCFNCEQSSFYRENYTEIFWKIKIKSAKVREIGAEEKKCEIKCAFRLT